MDSRTTFMGKSTSFDGWIENDNMTGLAGTVYLLTNEGEKTDWTQRAPRLYFYL
jgi:hypothetical protein